MNMYATFTFTSVVAWSALVLTSLIFIMAIAGAILVASSGKVYPISWRRVGVIFAIWFTSGWYLFG